MIWLWLYNLLIWIALPCALLRLWWRGRKLPAYRDNWQQRLGRGMPTFDQPPLWLHAVSVGESVAATPLIEALLALPNCPPILITTTTPTGAERVKHTFGKRVQHAYLPYDMPFAIRGFLKHCRPRLALIMETEIWPNLMQHLVKQGIPSILTNARLSARAFNRYGWAHGLIYPPIASFDWIGVQTEADAARFLALGAHQQHVKVLGNLKYDVALPNNLATTAQQLRQRWGAQRPCWVAASTHAGEEKIVLAAFQHILKILPDALLVLVPRHPQRFDDVARLCQDFSLARHSNTGATLTDTTQIYLGDTLGDLLLFYAATDLAFIGGSLVGVGGHNPIEAAWQQRTIISGPHTHNFSDVFSKLAQAQALTSINDSKTLAKAVIDLLDNPEQRQQLGQRAQQAIAGETGACQRYLDLIKPLLN